MPRIQAGCIGAVVRLKKYTSSAKARTLKYAFAPVIVPFCRLRSLGQAAEKADAGKVSFMRKTVSAAMISAPMPCRIKNAETQIDAFADFVVEPPLEHRKAEPTRQFVGRCPTIRHVFFY
jgi:hypothetical protein